MSLNEEDRKALVDLYWSKTFQASKEDIDRYFPDALDLLEHIRHLAFN